MKKIAVGFVALFSILAMADTKLSQLPLYTGSSVGLNDSFPIVVPALGVNGTQRLKLFDLVNIPPFTTFNAATATALAGAPTQCGGGQFATGVAANGNANCSAVPAGSAIQTVVDGGNAAHNIAANDQHTRSGTALTAQRTYTLDACTTVGEVHSVKNLRGQTFNIVLAAFAGDNIDGYASITILPGNQNTVICGTAGTWDLVY